MKKKVPKIGFALGCGGAKGLAHIGVLSVLDAHGIKAEAVAGSSMGAIVGACYALGIDLTSLENEAKSINKRKAIRDLLDLSASRQSILKGEKAAKYIESLIGGASFGDTKIPLEIIATDLETGNEVVLNEGSIAKAIQASISVPGVFPPVKIGGRLLIDGGIVNPTPVNRVDAMGMDIIIAVDLTTKVQRESSRSGMVSTLMQSYEIIRTQGARYHLENSKKHVIMIKPKLRKPFDGFKFFSIEKFIEAGRQAAEEALPEILALG